MPCHYTAEFKFHEDIVKWSGLVKEYLLMLKNMKKGCSGTGVLQQLLVHGLVQGNALQSCNRSRQAFTECTSLHTGVRGPDHLVSR